MNRKKWAGLALLLLLPVLYYIFGGEKNPNDISPIEQKVNQVEAAHKKPEVAPFLYYITGAVEEPGLYTAEKALTVGELIKQAGGLLPYANPKALNLAASVESGVQVHVPFDFQGDPAELIRKQKININTADEKALTAIRGVGPATAKRIIEYRTEKGPFTRIEDIQKVKGIGPAMFKKCKDAITV